MVASPLSWPWVGEEQTWLTWLETCLFRQNELLCIPALNVSSVTEIWKPQLASSSSPISKQILTRRTDKRREIPFARAVFLTWKLFHFFRLARDYTRQIHDML